MRIFTALNLLIGIAALAIVNDADACGRRHRRNWCPTNNCAIIQCCQGGQAGLVGPPKGVCSCTGAVSCAISCPGGCFTYKVQSKCVCHCSTDAILYNLTPTATIKDFTCSNAKLGDLDRIFSAVRDHGATVSDPDKLCTTTISGDKTVKQIFDILNAL